MQIAGKGGLLGSGDSRVGIVPVIGEDQAAHEIVGNTDGGGHGFVQRVVGSDADGRSSQLSFMIRNYSTKSAGRPEASAMLCAALWLMPLRMAVRSVRSVSVAAGFRNRERIECTFLNSDPEAGVVMISA